MKRTSHRRCACGALVQSGKRCKNCESHKSLYSLRDWRDRTQPQHLQSHPWCTECSAKGIKTKATVVDHIVPHRGDRRLFFRRSNLQSLCARCHAAKSNSEKQ